MPLQTFLRGLQRQPWGPLLLAIQLALTAAIIANALQVAAQFLDQLQDPSGLAEENLLAVESQRFDAQPMSNEETLADLAALRGIPGVSSVSRLNSFPLADHGWRLPVQSAQNPDVPSAQLHAGLFIVHNDGFETLGLRLIEGRAPLPIDMAAVDFEKELPSKAWISQSLSKLLFPNGHAVGQHFTVPKRGEMEVIGVVEKLTSAWPDWPLHQQTILAAAPVGRPPSLYVIRTDEHSLDSVRALITPALTSVSTERLLGPVRSYIEIRSKALRPQRGLIVILLALIASLLLVSGLGIFGTARYWVMRRRRQIGTRRALGAQRVDILRQFLGENLVITAFGLLAALPLALALNASLAEWYGVPPLGFSAILLTALLQLAVGQLAVLGPARSAAALPPALAARQA